MGEMLLISLSPVLFVITFSSDALPIFFVSFLLNEVEQHIPHIANNTIIHFTGFRSAGFGVVIDDSRPTFGCL